MVSNFTALVSMERINLALKRAVRVSGERDVAGERREQVTMAGSVLEGRPHLAASRTKPSFHTPLRNDFSFSRNIEISLSTDIATHSVAPHPSPPVTFDIARSLCSMTSLIQDNLKAV